MDAETTGTPKGSKWSGQNTQKHFLFLFIFLIKKG